MTIAAEPEPPIRVAAFQPHSAGLVQTRLPHLKESVLQSTSETTAARLESLGSRLHLTRTVEHRSASVARELADLRARGCDLLLVVGASAICDRQDVIPEAIEAAGGIVEHFGMPVDPGNLLLLGSLDGTPVLGLPGCARSPKINGFDWVLRRILAGLTVTGGDIMAMGVGGLLNEEPERIPHTAESARRPRVVRPPVAAVVLAAGRSTRMGPENKLMVPLAGKPMVLYAVEAALASTAAPVIVVVGHEADRVRDAVGDLPVRIVENRAYADGMSTSIFTGLQAVPARAEGAVFVLGDMPRIRPEHIDRLIAAFDPAAGRAICVATHNGQRGHPVLWHRTFFAEFTSLSNDQGGRDLFERHADRVHPVPMDDDGVLVDIDDRRALRELAESLNT